MDEAMPAALVARALGPDELDCEQAGYVDLERRELRMAGGEFCVNATRALGALLAMDAGRRGTVVRRCTVRVSGWPGEVELSMTDLSAGAGKAGWHVTAGLELPDCPVLGLAGGFSLVRLPGISHLLAGPGELPTCPVKARTRALLEKYGLMEEAAAGVIWWRRVTDGLAIRPVVRVRDVDTLYEETSCGSGSLALALLVRGQGREDGCDIVQPGGDVLRVDFADSGRRVLVGGRVGFAGSGVWRP